MTRVLFVSAYDPRTGVVSSYRGIADELRGHGIRFDAYGLTGWREDSPFRGFCDILHGPVPSLTEVLVREKYDVVHCIDTAYEAPFYVDRWLRRARFRGGVLISSQNSGETPLTRRPIAAQVAVACSDAAAATMRRLLPNVRVIVNGIDHERFRPIDISYNGPPILLWVGRSSEPEQKDLPGFLAVTRRNPQYRAVVVDAEERPASVAGHDVDYRHELGVDEMVTTYNATRASGGACVSTSRFEGMSFAVLEAAACGCPVIAPRVPGMEHLVDGSTAILYDRTDDLSQLNSALNRLPALSDHVSKQGRLWVEKNHTQRASALAYLKAYKDAQAAADRQRRVPTDRAVRGSWTVTLRVRRRVQASKRWVRGAAVEPPR